MTICTVDLEIFTIKNFRLLLRKRKLNARKFFGGERLVLDKRWCSSYGTAQENMDYVLDNNPDSYRSPWWYCTALGYITVTLKITKISNFRDFSEIKRMRTTVCTRRSSSPLLQIGTPVYEANNGFEGKRSGVCECKSSLSDRVGFNGVSDNYSFN